jgi:hypothetical protein
MKKMAKDYKKRKQDLTLLFPLPWRERARVRGK